MDISSPVLGDVRISDDVRIATEDLISLRREFHQHPELGLEEHRTQQRVLAWLAACGIEANPIAGTGVVSTISGMKTGRVILLRADMDALPIEEAGDCPFKSERTGVMHACGHDAHMAMLLVLARILKEGGIKAGTVKLMFQPAEEGGGGALKMIKAGILKDPDVDASLTFHVWTPFPVGQVCALDGPMAASVDGFRITVKGKGTHAATPEDGVDPVAIAAQIITSAQVLVTRRIRPSQPVVLTFTAVESGQAFNVIPGEARILGTFRTFDEAVRRTVRNGLKTLASGIARSFGGEATYESLVDHIPVINAPSIAALARQVSADVVGQERLILPPPLMVGEDIGEIQHRVPGALVALGAGNPSIGAEFPHHHPQFAIDEQVLPIGVEIGLRFVQRYLGDD
ncbi:MAG: M20 family metallopeptidase [Myxococcota bacterium]|nr:M20 family metallopeptidase [Myxococcota bacterium]